MNNNRVGSRFYRTCIAPQFLYQMISRHLTSLRRRRLIILHFIVIVIDGISTLTGDFEKFTFHFVKDKEIITSSSSQARLVSLLNFPFLLSPS